MKAIVGIVVALMLAVGIYISWTSDNTPEQEVPDTVAQQAAADPRAKTESEAAVVSTEPPADSEEQVEENPELDRIAELSGQEFAMALLQHSGDIETSIENILIMIESGRIDVNQRIVEVGGNNAMTPFLLAVSLSQGQLTLDQFNRFLDAGVTLQNDEISKEMMASVDNPEVIEVWYETAGFGPEDHERMLDDSLKNGNLALAKVILKDKKGELDGIQLSSKAVQRSIRRLESTPLIKLEELREKVTEVDEKTLKMVESFMVPLLQNNVDKTEILLEYAELSGEQRAEVVAANERYRNELEELREILATGGSE